MFVESSGGLFDHICVDSSRVCSFASFELVDGVAEFLHHERRHCVLVLLVIVLVFVFVSLRRGCVEVVELCEHIRNILSVVLVVASFVQHVCYEYFHAFGFDGCRDFESAEVAQDVCDAVSSFFCVFFVRIFFLIILLVSFLVCLSSVGVGLCFVQVVEVTRRDRCS